jgi:hypothetical protein
MVAKTVAGRGEQLSVETVARETEDADALVEFPVFDRQGCVVFGGGEVGRGDVGTGDIGGGATLVEGF